MIFNYRISYIIVLFTLNTASPLSYAQEGCMEIKEGEDKVSLIITNLCIEGRQLTISLGGSVLQRCLIPGGTTTLPRKPRELGEITITDEGECK